MALHLEDEELDIIDIRANGSLSPFYLSYFWVMEPSSPFLKILPYEVTRGWVEGLNGHKVSVEGTAKYNVLLPLHPETSLNELVNGC